MLQIRNPHLSMAFTNYTEPLKAVTDNSTLECPTESWVPFYIFLSPVVLTGLVGNGLITFIYVRHANIRSAPNTLLFNLAIADFITLVLCLTAPAYDHIGPLVPVVCPLIRILMETAMHVTGFTLLFLSMERYLAIAKPFRSKTASATFITRSVGLIWSSGVTFSMLKFALQTPADCGACVRMIDARNITSWYAVTAFVAFYVVPLAIIALFYVLMARKLYFSGPSIKETNPGLIRQMNIRKRIAFRVLILVIIYAVSFFPYHFFSLKLFFLEDLEQARQLASLIPVLYCIGCTHISLNPFILYFLSQAFRAHFNNYLFCCIFKYTIPREENNTMKPIRDNDRNIAAPEP